MISAYKSKQSETFPLTSKLLALLHLDLSGRNVFPSVVSARNPAEHVWGWKGAVKRQTGRLPVCHSIGRAHLIFPIPRKNFGNKLRHTWNFLLTASTVHLRFKRESKSDKNKRISCHRCQKLRGISDFFFANPTIENEVLIEILKWDKGTTVAGNILAVSLP